MNYQKEQSGDIISSHTAFNLALLIWCGLLLLDLYTTKYLFKFIDYFI